MRRSSGWASRGLPGRPGGGWMRTRNRDGETEHGYRQGDGYEMVAGDGRAGHELGGTGRRDGTGIEGTAGARSALAHRLRHGAGGGPAKRQTVVRGLSVRTLTRLQGV